MLIRICFRTLTQATASACNDHRYDLISEERGRRERRWAATSRDTRRRQYAVRLRSRPAADRGMGGRHPHEAAAAEEARGAPRPYRSLIHGGMGFLFHLCAYLSGRAIEVYESEVCNG